MLANMTKALVVIDVQESFRIHPLWPAVSNPEIVEQVNRLVQQARDNSDLVVWVFHTEPHSNTLFDPELGHVRAIAGLEAPAADEPVLMKTSHNAFTTTNLLQLLTERGIQEVVICGMRTEQCCETTARVASDLGLIVTFVTDATATTPLPHRDLADRSLASVMGDRRTLSAGDVIERTEYALAGRFATIATVDEVITGRASR